MSAVVRKAKKDHLCSLCGETIAIGEPYVFERVAPWHHSDNERFFDYKAHSECNRFWTDEYSEERDGYLPDDEGTVDPSPDQKDFAVVMRWTQAEEFGFVI